ncbi:hypothetical protein [Knoellia sp. LjRoot47]|uniref:hypothetical protein n=1 Tax=Knoellia sp. LjRoot47 TaxID=3342330 RepID=UPI003ECE075D
MSYDFAVLVPEAVGDSDPDTFTQAQRLSDDAESTESVDPRITAFHDDLVALIDALPEDGQWLSMWPLAPAPRAISIPVPYPEADEALLTLLRLAATHGLALVDLSSESVAHPPPGVPVSVKGGDGTRLGALTRDRLADLVAGLAPPDPYLVLDRGDRFAQTYRVDEGSYLLEHSGPDGHLGTTVTDPDVVTKELWHWLTDDPGFGNGLTFSAV